MLLYQRHKNDSGTEANTFEKLNREKRHNAIDFSTSRLIEYRAKHYISIGCDQNVILPNEELKE